MPVASEPTRAVDPEQVAAPVLAGRREEPRSWSAVLRSPLGLTAVACLLVLAAVSLLAPPLLDGPATTQHVADRLQGPSWAHPLGTDSLGRDVLARVLLATRLSILLALGATAAAVVLGGLLGMLPSVVGTRSSRLLTAAINTAVAFPALLLSLFFAIVWGVGSAGAAVAIGLAWAPAFARLTHTLTASALGRDYLGAARILGVSRRRILLRHLLPNIAQPLAITAMLGAGGALLAFAGLSFLGFGVQYPDYDWGRLLSDGLERLYSNPAAALGPAVAIVFAGVSFSLFGEAIAAGFGLRPRRRHAHAAGPPPIAFAPERHPDARSATAPLVSVDGLRIAFPAADDAGTTVPVDGVSFEIAAGETVGVVGESGSGKSLTALAIAGLIEAPGAVAARRLEFLGESMLVPPSADLQRLLGTSMTMVFQDPGDSLNPVMRVGSQLAEVAEVHRGAGRRAALAEAVERLREVQIADPEHRARQYPHEFSGGMRQRAMIGIGLMGAPRLVIADEPTTALDVTVQRQVLGLLRSLRDEAGTAVMLISHDVAVISAVCERVLVMYSGTVVEDLGVGRLLSGPAHPYTRALLRSVPQMDADRSKPLDTIPGRPPDPAARPAGCPFAPRCAYADERCHRERPAPVERATGHRVACWHPQT